VLPTSKKTCVIIGYMHRRCTACIVLKLPCPKMEISLCYVIWNQFSSTFYQCNAASISWDAPEKVKKHNPCIWLRTAVSDVTVQAIQCLMLSDSTEFAVALMCYLNFICLSPCKKGHFLYFSWSQIFFSQLWKPTSCLLTAMSAQCPGYTDLSTPLWSQLLASSVLPPSLDHPWLQIWSPNDEPLNITSQTVNMCE
jgi:hypothetical protein